MTGYFKRGLTDIKHTACLILLLGAGYHTMGYAGPAINQFEVKDLEVEVGKWEFQSQNAHLVDRPARKFISQDSGGYEYDDNSISKQRHALEIEVGLMSNLRSRFGIEYEKERLDGSEISHTEREGFNGLALEELALEVVYVVKPPVEDEMGFGFLVEFQRAEDRQESDSLVVNLIVEVKRGLWNVVLNPGLVKHYGGSEEDNKVDFSYGLQALKVLSDTISFGVEGYGTIDRLRSTGTPDENAILFNDHDQHRLGPVIYLTYGTTDHEHDDALILGIGVFAGLNKNTAGTTLKWSLEYEF